MQPTLRVVRGYIPLVQPVGRVDIGIFLFFHCYPYFSTDILFFHY